MMAPQTITEDHRSGGIFSKLFPRKSGAEERRDTQQWEKIRGNKGNVDLLGRGCLPRVAQVTRKNTIRRNFRKYTVAFADIVKCCSSDIQRVLMLFLQNHNAARLVERQRPEQNGVHDAEDRGVGPDSERQSEDGHSREA